MNLKAFISNLNLMSSCNMFCILSPLYSICDWINLIFLVRLWAKKLLEENLFYFSNYTITIYPRKTIIVFFYYMTRTIFTKWSNLLVYWQIVILYFDILGLLSILKSRCRGACIFGWSRGFIHDFDYVGIVTTCK